MIKKIFPIALIIILCISILHFLYAPLVKKDVITSIKVYPGQNISVLSQNLYQQKIIHHPLLFQWLVEISGNSLRLRYGEYEVKYPMNVLTLLNHMTHGTHLVKHRLTIVNGWTFTQVRAMLSADPDLNQTLTNQPSTAILQQLNTSESHMEGLLYPDTYFFTWGNTDISVLKTAYEKMQTTLQADWQNRAPDLPYKNAYQALIVASLIEKETSVDAEKPLIASVILNRLDKHMRLQIDSAVQYGVDGVFGGVLTQKELDTKTPYNTYLMDGLPPTPICMPSNSSIVAALHPVKTDYLYYVATGTGGHNFSKSYAEHLKQVAAYRKT